MAKEEARQEARNQARIGHEQLLQEINRAKDDLRKQVAKLAVAGAEKILMREIDEAGEQCIVR